MSQTTNLARKYLEGMLQKYGGAFLDTAVSPASAAEDEWEYSSPEAAKAGQAAPGGADEWEYSSPEAAKVGMEAAQDTLLSNRGDVGDFGRGLAAGVQEPALGVVQMGRRLLPGESAIKDKLGGWEQALTRNVTGSQPGDDTGAFKTGRFMGAAIPTLPIAALGGGTQAAVLPRLASLGASGAAVGAMQPVLGPDYGGEKTMQVLGGAGLSAGVGGVAEAMMVPRKIMSGIVARSLNSPAGLAGEQLSAETGIHLTPAAKSGSRALNLAENAARQSFFTADKALQADIQTGRDVAQRLSDLAGAAPDKGGVGQQIRDTFTATFDNVLNQRAGEAATNYGRVRDLAGNERMFYYDNTLRELQKIVDETSGVVGADAAKVNSQARDAIAKLTKPEEAPKVAKINTEVDPERDDVITAIRKLGGIDKTMFGDSWREWTFKPNPAFGPVWRNTGGRSLDEMATVLQERGYLSWDDPVRELEEIIVEGSKGTLAENLKWARVKSDWDTYYDGPLSQQEDILQGLDRATGAMHRLSDMFMNRNAAKTKPRQGILGTIDEAMKNRSAWTKATRGDGGLFDGISADANRKYASRLLGSLDQDFEEAGEAPGALGQYLKEANQAYRKSSLEAEAIKKSPLGSRMGKEYKLPNGETEYTVAPEKVIDALNGLPESQLSQTIDFIQKNNPQALADLERYYIRNALKVGQEPVPSQGLRGPEISGTRTIQALPGKSANSDAAKIIYRYNPQLREDVAKVEEAIRMWGDKFGYNTSGTAPMNEFLQAVNSVLGFTLRGASTVGGKFLGLDQVAEAMRTPAGRQAVYDLATLGPKSREATKALSVLGAYAATQPQGAQYQRGTRQ